MQPHPGAPAVLVTASQLTASEYARELLSPDVAVVIRRGSETMTSTLPSAAHRSFPRRGTFSLGGSDYRAIGCPDTVRVHDFIDPDLGKVAPYGIYDIAANAGWVSVGIDHDTAAFAVHAIRRWYDVVGRDRYSNAERLLITADGGGSNGSRVRLWKLELQKLADETGLSLQVCHYPPGTSKWMTK